MYNKTIIGFGFCDMQNYQCRGKTLIILHIITLTSTLIIQHITKTSSNNCLISRKIAELPEFYKRSHIVNLSYLANAIKKILDKFRFTGTLIYLTTKQVNNMWEEKLF